MAIPNTPSDRESLLLIEKYVENQSRQFTINDAASLTGVPVLETEYAVKDLMKKYDCKLKVTENGDLIYDFGERLHRRTAKSFGEYVAEAMAWLWSAFTVFYKFMTSILLIVYFVVFLVILIAIILGTMSSDRDSDSKGVGNLIGAIFRVFWSIFEWNTIMGYGYTYNRYDDYGYEYRHYNEKPSAVKRALKGDKAVATSPEEKGFVASIYDFIFGAPRVEENPLANKQEVASFLRKHKGLISTAELQALAGWTRAEADNFMTECLAHFNGRAEISPNGTLYGDFSELIRSNNRTGEVPIVYYWDEYEAPYEVTGNTTGRNWAIASMNVFNLLLSSFFLANIGFGGLAAWIFLGWIPFIYSALFFLIPLARTFALSKKRKQYHINNIRKRLIKAIFQSSSPEISLARLTQIANEGKRSKEANLDEKTVEQVMKDVIYDFKGDSYLDDNAQVIYRFEDLDRELNDVEEAREDKKGDNRLGDIIMEA